MKPFLLLFLPVWIIVCAQAQQRSGAITERSKMKITGTVIDKTSQSIVAGAHVQLLTDNSDDEKTKEPAFSRDVITKLDGTFEFSNVPFTDTYKLIITTVGYKALQKNITISRSTGNNALMVLEDAGKIALEPAVKSLADVTVTSTAKPTMQLGVDRKIFNVEKNITAQGGTAVDVMKNIPSLTVDVNGNVEMRNTSPQILVDGRPTILTLDQIPADDIERVELLTNPSSKYDASSAGGIINVVLKKNKRVGFNGLASVGAGTPGVLNGNLSLNIRQKKFNFFGSGNYNKSGGFTTEKTFRQNKNNSIVTDYFNQVSENERQRKFNTVRFGTDYFIDDKNTLSFTQGFTNGRFGNSENQSQEYLDVMQQLDHTGKRQSDGTSSFNRRSSNLTYDKVFDRPDKKFTADITYNSGSRSSASFITTKLYNPDGSIYQPDNVVRNAGSGTDNQFTAQLDYSNPVNENKKIEFGLRTYFNNTATAFGTYAVGSTGETKLPLSNNYKYKETVHAGYFNYANKFKTFKYQLGLRVELSKLDGELIDSNFRFGYQYPDKLKNIFSALFPSFFLTKAINEREDLQFNYSKRIRRPRFWEVNPFVDINDPLNISQGNPALTPEYVHSFELNYFNRFKKEGSFLAVLYFRNNGGDITDYSDTISNQLYAQLASAGVSPNAIINTYINAGYTNRYGTEFTLQKKVFKDLEFTYNINLQYRNTSAKVNQLNLSNSGFNYDTKLIAGYKITSEKSKLFNNLSFQLVTEYESPRVIPQGKTKSQFVSDFAMRKEFFKSKAASLSVSVNDIFNTRRYGSIYDTEKFYQDSYSRWSVRTFRVTLSYKFGDADFDLFKKRKSNDDGEG